MPLDFKHHTLVNGLFLGQILGCLQVLTIWKGQVQFVLLLDQVCGLQVIIKLEREHWVLLQGGI